MQFNVRCNCCSAIVAVQLFVCLQEQLKKLSHHLGGTIEDQAYSMLATEITAILVVLVVDKKL